MFFLRLDGSPNFAMFCNIVASVLNIILDYLFIFPFGWGMFGAAFASAIGTTVGALMIIIYLSRRNCVLRFYPVKFSRNSMKLMKRNVGYMCRLGSSAFLCEVAIACMMFVGNLVFIHYLKEDGVAAFSIACYFFPIIFMVYNAIAQSAQPIISFNYGLNETLRVRKTYLLALKTAVGSGICFALITIFCSREIVAMFIDRSYPAYDIAVKGLAFICIRFRILCNQHSFHRLFSERGTRQVRHCHHSAARIYLIDTLLTDFRYYWANRGFGWLPRWQNY